MKKVVYLRESNGDDKNHGLSEDAPVLTWERGIKIAIREGTQEFDIEGSEIYHARIRADAEKDKRGGV